MTNQTSNPENGEYDFSINYSERLLGCHVSKKGNHLHLHVDNNLEADFELQEDNSLVQTSGSELPDSIIDFVRKHVIGHDK